MENADQAIRAIAHPGDGLAILRALFAAPEQRRRALSSEPHALAAPYSLNSQSVSRPRALTYSASTLPAGTESSLQTGTEFE